MLAFLDTLDLIYAVQTDEKIICASSLVSNTLGRLEQGF